MRKDDQTIAPVTALRILRWFCPPHLREEIEGDLIQKFYRDVEAMGELRARLMSMWNSVRFFRPEILLRNDGQSFRIGNKRTWLSGRPMTFQQTSSLIGWVVFSIALVTYCLTVEETASYRDCGEFIATSYKLQVPHPPGAPLFLLMGRVFSLFALGDVMRIAYAINMMSVLASAFTILFLFWSIVLFGRKIVEASNESIEERKWLLMSAGTIGALTYAFSDSFWFSAVEAEVYAMSSLTTAFVVWGILKWDTLKDRGHANRWLILVAYVIGLSIGIHLLNLLALPALALIYYFRTFKTYPWGIVTALAAGLALVLCINDLIVPGLPTLAGYFELFFVNSLGLFFGSGAIVFALLIVASLVFGIWHTHKRNYVTGSTIVLAFTFVLIGYCSYVTVVVRSNFDPLINENAPKDVMSFVRYLKREQYGSRPLLFGPYFTADPISGQYGAPKYRKGKDRYEIGEREYELEYRAGDQTILPRAWNPENKEDYEQLLGLREGQKPTMAQNISYMFQHQIGTMYLRYFMWNFAGRSGDEQGSGWLRPVEWFKKIPAAMTMDKARNNFFMIPFLLGIIGIFYQILKDGKGFLVIGLLFIMLGVAIVVYLNSPPAEPRERDYIYVGSYYAFAVWIGLAVLSMADGFVRIFKSQKISLVAASLIGMSAPLVMVVEGWDDHDRSNRFFSVDAATNALNSCNTNGMVFTGGDNDTFPLWYAQETEGCRTDLRVLVLSYCNTDWYIDQTTRQAYISTPFKYTLKPEQYRQGGPNDGFLPYVNLNIDTVDAKEYLDLLARDYAPLRQGDRNVVPSKIITLPVDKKAILAKGIVPKEMENFLVDQMQFRLLDKGLEKKDLVFLDLLVTNNWERPIYLNSTSLSQMKIDMKPYAVQEGNVYRILPVKNPRRDRDYLVDTEKTYDLMMNKFSYRGLNDEGVYYNNDYRIQVLQHRSNLNSLAEALIDKGEVNKTERVLDFSLEKMPDTVVPYDPSAPDSVSLLFKVGHRQKAIEVATTVGNRSMEMASYLISEGQGLTFELRKNLFLLGAMQRTLYENNETVLARDFEVAYEKLIADFENSGRAGE